MRKLLFAIAAILLLATGYLLAQPAGQIVTTTKDKVIATKLPTPKTIPIGENLALRIDGEHQGRVIGTLLVNRNGQWSEVIIGSQNSFAGR